jgi:hypothetical protein
MMTVPVTVFVTEPIRVCMPTRIGAWVAGSATP